MALTLMKKYSVKIYFLAFIICLPFHNQASNVVKRTIITATDTTVLHFVNDTTLKTEGWDTLSHAIFWKQVIQMTSDSCMVNVAAERKCLCNVNRKDWMQLKEATKDSIKDSICIQYALDTSTVLYVTSGKQEFYQLRRVLPDVGRAVSIFENAGVDPWFAQAVLLIESPGKQKAKSYVGANGPFQLMKSVALKFGLKVNKYVDERTELDKAAVAAAKLIGNVCIPEVKRILSGRNIQWNENELWFKLLVMHVYHAGAGNVACAINSMDTCPQGRELIRKLWKTECGSFKNESQNYSQLALATQLTFNDILESAEDTIYLIQGDQYFTNALKHEDVSERKSALISSLDEYETDLLDGTIEVAEFLNRTTKVAQQLNKIEKKKTAEGIHYPALENEVDSIASLLMKRYRFDDAISILKINSDQNKNSIAAIERLVYAYTMKGDKLQAVWYNNKATNMRNGNLNGSN